MIELYTALAIVLVVVGMVAFFIEDRHHRKMVAERERRFRERIKRVLEDYE